jgi:DNA-binding response OmpR family regulator
MTDDRTDSKEQKGTGPPGSAGNPGVEKRRRKITEKMTLSRSNYGQELCGRLASLQALLVTLEANPGLAAEFEEARALAHNIRGTAASYGFAEAGFYAGEVEDFLWDLSDGISLDACDWQQTFACLARAKRASRSYCPARLMLPAVQESPGSPCILLAGGSRQSLQDLSRLAEPLCLAAFVGGSFQESLLIAGRQDLDAVIVDCAVSDRGESVEFVQALRRQPGKETVPVAFLQSAGLLSEKLDASYAGSALLAEKPVETTEFKALVKNLLSLRCAREASVLVVSSEPQLCRRCHSLLCLRGIVVSTLEDAAGLVDSLKSSRADLLIFSLAAGQLNGFEIARLLRSLPEWWNLPLLAVLPDDSWQLHVAAYEAGIDDVVSSKSCDEELTARVISMLKQRRQAAQYD